MEFKPITLPYAKNALEPYISKETMDYHFDKHYMAYLDNTNKLRKGSAYEGKAIEDIIHESESSLLNNAAQMKNHELFFEVLSPNPVFTIDGEFEKRINRAYGSLDKLKERMSNMALKLFGSGWIWLVLKRDGHLKVMSGKNAYCPLIGKMVPLLCIDVWEHAYYIDYRNKRPEYVQNIWKIIDWSVVQKRYEDAYKLGLVFDRNRNR